jgi:hypothetical protein
MAAMRSHVTFGMEQVIGKLEKLHRQREKLTQSLAGSNRIRPARAWHRVSGRLSDRQPDTIHQLERQPGVKLHDTRPACSRELPKVRAANVRIQPAEVRVIECIQQIAANLQPVPFTDMEVLG